MARFKVWYTPQIPMKAFEVEKPTLVEAQAALDMLIDFSLFEFENKIKPDYSDACGVTEWDEDAQEWFDCDDALDVMGG
jgi:hypothetical protein